jgi:antitoxin component YwqK of YwqJK toxin-antitoxin module
MAGVVDGWWVFSSQVPHGAVKLGAPAPEGEAVWCEIDGLRDGPFTAWWPGTEITRRQGLFIEGEQVGLWMLWHRNGKKRRMGSFEAGLETGRFVSWFDNGRTESEGSYVEGRRDGQWTWYRREHRRKHREASYHLGYPHGDWREWFDNGSPALSCGFEHGKRHGPHREWHTNGSAKVIGEYFQGKKHLHWKVLDQDGQCIERETWQHGRLYEP